VRLAISTPSVLFPFPFHILFFLLVLLGFAGKHFIHVVYPVWGSHSFHASGWMRDGENSTVTKVHATLKDAYFTDSLCNIKKYKNNNLGTFESHIRRFPCEYQDAQGVIDPSPRALVLAMG
jgi:hypothetical protein